MKAKEKPIVPKPSSSGKAIKKKAHENLPKFGHFNFSAVTDITQDAYVLITPAGVIADWNKSAGKMFGHAAAEVIGKPIWQIEPEISKRQVMAVLKLIKKGQPIVYEEKSYKRKNGQTICISLNVVPLMSPEEEVTGIICIARNLTDKEIRATDQSRHEIFINNIEDACFEFDLHGRCMFCNEAAYRMLGFSRDEYMNLRHHERYATRKEADRVYNIYNHIYEAGAPSTFFECQALCKDGSSITMEEVISPIRNPHGMIEGFRGIGRDITTSKKGQADQERYRDFLENISDGCFETDLRGNLIYLNKAAEQMRGFKRNEVLGASYKSFTDPEEARHVYDIFNKVYKTGEPGLIKDYEMPTQDGQRRWVDMAVTLMKDAREKKIGFRGVSRDVTENKKFQEDLERSESRYRNLFQYNAAPMILIDPETEQIVDANLAACSYYGYTKEEFLRKKDGDINEMTPEAIREEIKAAQNEGRRQFCFMHRMASGIVRPVEVFAGPVEIGGKQLLYRIIHDIGERRKAEEALRASEEKYRSIIENMLDAYFECDLSGRFTFANNNVCNTLGCTMDELLQSDYRAFTQPKMARKIRAAYLQVLQRGIPGTLVDYEVICKDGKILSHELSVALMRDTAGNPIGFRTISRDITKRKEAERMFIELANLNQTILDTVGVGLVLVKDRRFGWMNQTYLDMMGYSYDDAFNVSTLNNYIHVEDADLIGRESPSVLSRGEIYSKEIQFKGKDGHPIWVYLQGKALDPHDLSQGAVWMIMDIDERKKAEEALRESEQKYKFLAEGMSDIVWIMDLNLKTLYVSPSIKTVLGFTQEESLRHEVNEELTPQSLLTAREALSTELTLEKQGHGDPDRTVTLPLEFYHKDGSTRWLETAVSPIRDHREVLTRFYGVSRDITERKAAEQALRESEEKYRAILSNMRDGYFETDLLGTITFINNAGCNMMNGTPDQLLGQKSRYFMTPAARKLLRERYRLLTETGRPDIMSEYEVVTCDGSIRVHQSNATLRKDAAGAPIGYSIVSRDITERKRAEEALHHSEERIRALFNNIPVPTFVWKVNQKDVTLEEVNSTAMEFTHGDIAAFIGKSADEYCIDFPAIPAKIRQCFLSQSSMEHSFWHHRKFDLEERYVTVKYAYAAPDHVIMHVNDLTAQKKAEENLKHISIHDALTGLYNRFYSDAEIDRISASRIRPVSFIMIDLNDLKGINDQKGHAAGDLYINNAAALLKQTFRPEDMVARIGGDEFFVMLPLVDEETCNQALNRLRDHLAQFNKKVDQPISLAAGFSTAYSGDNIEKKIAEADRNMYEEKAQMKMMAGKQSEKS